MNLKQRLAIPCQAVWSVRGGAEARRLTRDFSFADGSRRVYHYHLRKTAGTSLNAAFWALGDADDEAVHRALRADRQHRVVAGGKVFVSHNRYLIRQGHYFFANSHFAWPEIPLPPQTCTVTIFRDPVARLVSHYKMLVHLLQTDTAGPVLRKREGGWVRGGLSGFLRVAPRAHLMRQLTMFSPRFDIHEAIDRVMACSHVMMTETFDQDLERLGTSLGLALRAQRRRVTPIDVEVTQVERDDARELLEPEYKLIEAARAHPSRNGQPERQSGSQTECARVETHAEAGHAVV